jgi:hypothetical protein
LRNCIFIHAIKNGLELPVSGSSVVVDMDEDDVEINLDFTRSMADYETAGEEWYRTFKDAMSGRFNWIRSALFDTDRLMTELREDNAKLHAILGKTQKWDAGGDRKLIALERLVKKTHKREKIIVFTQYADTAEYIHEQLHKTLGGQIALALGGSDNIVDLVNYFSPVSNGFDLTVERELRVLITTDILSEGQNLQDAHIIVNFDLPWAIVRLIQRAGRIDRIGQKSPQILCYSFLPEDGIEKIIGLRKKLSERIKENAEVVGSDEMFFDGDPINISDLYSEKAGIFDEDDDNEVDLASYAYQIWKNATDEHPELKDEIERLPNVVFSAKASVAKPNDSGAIVYVKANNDNDALAWVDERGDIVTHSQYTILKAAECAFDEPALEKLGNHHELVSLCVNHIQKEADSVTGTIGRKNSIKNRVYNRLKRYADENNGTLFVSSDLQFAIDAIVKNPLKETATDAFSRQMKAGISDGALADLAVALHREGRLCVERSQDDDRGLPQVICSMSLIGGQS